MVRPIDRAALGVGELIFHLCRGNGAAGTVALGIGQCRGGAADPFHRLPGTAHQHFRPAGIVLLVVRDRQRNGRAFPDIL